MYSRVSTPPHGGEQRVTRLRRRCPHWQVRWLATTPHLPKGDWARQFMTHSTANGRIIRGVCWFPCLPKPLGNMMVPSGSHSHHGLWLTQGTEFSTFYSKQQTSQSPCFSWGASSSHTVVAVTYFVSMWPATGTTQYQKWMWLEVWHTQKRHAGMFGVHDGLSLP